MEVQEVQQIVKSLGGIRKTGREVGIPPSTLCEYLKGVYKGRKRRVLQVFEDYVSQVECPVAGRITKEQCNRYQTFKATNSFNVKVYKACKTCLQAVCNKPTSGK